MAQSARKAAAVAAAQKFFPEEFPDWMEARFLTLLDYMIPKIRSVRHHYGGDREATIVWERREGCSFAELRAHLHKIVTQAPKSEPEEEENES